MLYTKIFIAAFILLISISSPFVNGQDTIILDEVTEVQVNSSFDTFASSSDGFLEIIVVK